MSKTFVIAEAGANHDRNESQAFRLVDEAVNAGADAVKFQTYSSDTLYSKYTPDFAGYKNIPKLIKDLELPRSWQKTLKSYCDDNGIEFMSTPFDERAVDELYKLGVKRFKISGFECTDPRFVKYVASTKLPLVISLGIGTNLDTLFQIQRWILDVDDVEDVHLGTHDFSNNPNITYLHCNNAYPTPFKDINLGTMSQIKNYMKTHKWFVNSEVGLSDHTEGILTPPIAVAMGAKVIEKHYTIDRTLSGPDHPFAIEPNELKDMVKNIRLVETMLDTKDTEYTESEQGFSMARRSVVTKVDLKVGDVLAEDNITTKRPLLKDSIPAIDYYDVIGKSVNVNIKKDDIIKRGNING
jgi:sialic acid synthase SpsE